MLLGIAGSGCGQGAGAGSDSGPLGDPRIDQAIKGVQSGEQDPRKLRNLIKEKISGKPQEKSLPKTAGRSRRRP